ncbi:MAG: MaoC family dehydratase N-terminal domain-containing protein, partial [Chloroflexota bacterium]
MVAHPTEHAVITPEMLEDVRKRIGFEFTPRDYPFWNTQANWDAVRQYCWGIGEDNALFNDAEYGKKRQWGTNVVPFNFLYSVYWCTGRYGLPGIHGWHSGNDWKLFKPILANDTISYTVKV